VIEIIDKDEISELYIISENDKSDVVQSEVQHGEHSEELNKREEISIGDLFVSELCDSGISSPPLLSRVPL
jgi:hypothetical protein